MPKAASKKAIKFHPRIPLPASLPGWHALLAPAVAHAFSTLRISAAIRERDEWYAIHGLPENVSFFELAHGRESERDVYNEGCIERALSQNRSVLGTHAGFSDFYVPIAVDGDVRAVLVTGPFARSRPTSSEILERWRALSGRNGYLSDREFSHYVSVTLDTLLLEGEQVNRYQRMLECLAALLAGWGDARALAAEAARLREKLQASRLCDRTWEEARSMVDERTAGIWHSTHRINDLSDLGLSGPPEHALVGLVLHPSDDVDAVSGLLIRDAFQRACFELCHARKNVACGRVGDRGVALLLSGSYSSARLKHTFSELAGLARELARKRFGLGLHVGTSSLSGSAPLPERYQEALGAAENALSQGLSLVHAHTGTRPGPSALRKLRDELSTLADARPKVLVVRFERYADAVALYSGYRPDLAQAHLEAGFGEVVRALRASGTLDARSESSLFEALDREAREAENASQLFSAYRRALSDVVAAAENPVRAAHDRSLRRAVSFIQQHFTEPLSSSQVAKLSGFAPGYFCQLFKRHEKVTFEKYVRRLRIERAKQLLVRTDLGMERVGQLSGFPLRHYFQRVFKDEVGLTPLAFRENKR